MRTSFFQLIGKKIESWITNPERKMCTRDFERVVAEVFVSDSILQSFPSAIH